MVSGLESSLAAPSAMMPLTLMTALAGAVMSATCAGILLERCRRLVGDLGGAPDLAFLPSLGVLDQLDRLAGRKQRLRRLAIAAALSWPVPVLGTLLVGLLVIRVSNVAEPLSRSLEASPWFHHRTA